MTSSSERSGEEVDGASVDGEPILDEEEFDEEDLDDDDDDLDDDDLDGDDFDDDDDEFDDDDDDLDDDDDGLDDDDLDDDDDDDLDDDLEDERLDSISGDGHGADAEYEAGDVNTISAAPGHRGEPGTDRGDMAVAVLDYLARSMADDPDAVVIRKESRRGSTILRLHVAPQDMGRIIGRRGRTAQAIRTLVAVAGASDGVQTFVDIADD